MTEDSNQKAEAGRTGSRPATDTRQGAAQPKKSKPQGNKSQVDPQLLRLGGAVLAGLIAGLLLGALLFSGDDGEDDLVSATASSTAAGSASEARIVTPEELAAEAAALGRPIYWAGPQGDASIELERTAEGNTSVRYIPADGDADAPAAEYLTVVTYPYPEANAALRQQAASGNLLSRELRGGGFVISQTNQPTNAYVAYPGEDYQVEVYDPRPGQALKLALEGSIVKAG